MKWFDGTITQAVQTSKSRKSVFIVYISGDDKVSTEVSKTIEDKKIEELQDENHCVAVKMQANSEDCGFFSQIYPVVLVPSIFFIGENGVPLEVVGGSITAHDLLSKMENVIETNKGKIPAESVPGYKPPPVTAATTASTSQDGASSSAATNTSTSTTPSPTKSEDLSTKLSKAEELIEKRREEKLRKEFEERKNKEEEKRQLGKDLQKLKQFQKEKEMQEVQEQLRKDKEADRIARQKVKEQIARDRAERSEKFNREKKEKEEKASEAKKAKLQEEQKAAVEAEARRSETARIQFRLPDGSSIPNSFPSTDTLQSVLDFITQHVGGPVTLSTTFPRRTFEDSDMNKTLIDLQLAPSAVLITVPKRSSIVPKTPGGSGDILTLLLAPFMFILNLIRSLFGGSSASSSASSSTPSSSSTQSSQSTASGGDRKQNQAFKRQTDSNIKRFRNSQDDDDENATWNGNSTQQM
ncbi:hypothetical protein LOTGIDRAFT_192354 [Lottia gigantea]|uniref:UBX domain-containing protein 4 n=1 Tax=Lottia gigantea TaxID=225164 RepID=V4AA44_LOTGI|nr:hypothetical protein LOTGIDRAFT_192354 [Lottia gigantea]ESO90181.1 hypothetical protein LOTGIDRAFT_192354 [Lottia gigantea]